DGAVTEQRLDPRDLDIPAAPADALRGGDVAFNTGVCRRLLAGERGAVRDAVLLNAAAALAVYEPTEAALVDRVKVAYARAEEAVDSGKAADVLDRWVRSATV
ncbi:MAG TPA: anthranilate phosphoribosyltransferase, partial [Actinopolymorphaceae bacterium]|nr:anthranilate phosphoribosyltransferase [Actinopolymorphaceae bacterium]